MPGRNPFLIVKDYLNPGEPVQVRKNAVTALATLDDEESRALLAEKAVTDESDEVKQKARDEIAAMPEGSSQQVLELVLRDLEDPQRQRTAYVLLGELRNKGLKFKFPAISFFSRIGLAKDMRDHLYPTRGARFWFRVLPGTLLGIIAAWVGIVLFFAGMRFYPDMSSSLLFLLVSGLVTLAVAIVATYMTSPARFYPDWVGGAFLEMGFVGVVAFFAAVVTILITIANIWELRPYFLMVCAPAAAASVRWGTLASFGLVRTKWLNRVIQTVVGGAFGVAVYELLTIVTRKNQAYFYPAAWLWMVVASYGLAAAFASIDAESEPRPATPRVLTAAALLVVVPCTVFNFAELIPPKSVQAQEPVAPVIIDLGELRSSTSFPVTALPAVFIFSVAEPSTLFAEFYPSSLGILDISRQGKEIANDSSILTSVSLAPRTQYQLTAKRRETQPKIEDGADELAKRLSWAEFQARIHRRELPQKNPELPGAHIELELRLL